MRRLDLADLVLIAGKTLNLDTRAVLGLLDIGAAEAALTESVRAEAQPGDAQPGQAQPGQAGPGQAEPGNGDGDPARQAAGLLHALIRRRPFRDGNEQVALVAAVQLLAINGWRADLGPAEEVRAVITEVAADHLPVAELAGWLSLRLAPYCESPAKEAPMHGWRPGRRSSRRTRGMFDRFSGRAREVIVAAQDEARALQHNYIGTEHILLGLIREGDGVAARALGALGISLGTVRQQVLEIIGQGKQVPAGHIPFTPRSKKVLDLALREAMHLGHLYVGTEHILLGLIREGDGVGCQVLVRLGADHALIREQVLRLLAGHRHPRSTRVPPEIRAYDARIAQARREKDAAIDAQDFDRAAALRDSEKHLLAEREELVTQWAADADVVALGQEVDRLGDEVRRLQEMLLEHGIEPGDADEQTA